MLYSLMEDSADIRGTPEIYGVVRGLVRPEPCPVCGSRLRWPEGDLLCTFSDVPTPHVHNPDDTIRPARPEKSP